MKPIIDLNKEYGLVFDGGGARGAYQIGAWRPLGSWCEDQCSSGYFCGRPEWRPLFVWEDLEKAEHIWKEMAFSPCYGCG